MNQVMICENPFNSETWKSYDTDNVCDLLVSHFRGSWPKGARVYYEQVAHSCDVTPRDVNGILRLQDLKGQFYVLVFPESFIPLAIWITIAINAATFILSIVLRPSQTLKNQQETSPNNQLSNRQNRERPLERIEDIYGEVWSTPTLIQVPYRIFQGNKEVEYAYMCIGRGEYDIAEVRDDLTPFEDIDGASAEFYGPNTSPNSGDAPFLRIGNPIHETIKKVKRYGSANGQVLVAPNASNFKADNNISFVSADSIVTTASIDFADYFTLGSVSSPTHITIANSNAKDPGSSTTLDLDGTYEIADIQGNTITLNNPASVNPNWSSLAGFSGGASTYGSPTLTSADSKWIGPFTISDPDVGQIWCNFVCPNGLYELDKEANQHSMDSEVQIGIQAIDSNGNAIGSEIYYFGTIIGSETVKTLRGITVKCPLPLTGPCKVRARRYSGTDLRDNWSVVDQTQWKDLYSVAPVSETDFGDVTTVQVVNWPTQDALAIKERKFNCLVTRKIPSRIQPPVPIPAGQQVKYVYPTTMTPHSGLCGGVASGAVTGDTLGALIQFWRSASTCDPGPYALWSGFVMPSLPADAVIHAIYPVCESRFCSPGLAFNGTKHLVGSNNLFGSPTMGPTPTYDSAVLVGSFQTSYGSSLGTSAGAVTGANIIAGFFASLSDIETAPGAQFQIKKPRLAIYYSSATENTDSQFDDSNLQASKNLADIICAMARDPYIGNRADTEIDVNGIYDAVGPTGDNQDYFGTQRCSEFCHTFDDSKVSFEEMVTDAANAGFSIAYRRGNILSVFFEKATANSTMLFNHRNKLPGTEVRSVRFGLPNDFDGIELNYVDPHTPDQPDIDATNTLYFPEDQSAVAPKKITVVGVRNNVQAKLLGWRMFQKLLYQNTTTEFSATQEAATCVRRERVLIADNTRSDTQDGEVVGQVSLEIELSQDVTLVGGHTYHIFLQHPDRTVESIAITGGSAPNKVVLGTTPATPLIYDKDKSVRTHYQIIDDNNSVRSSAFLLEEKSPQDGMVYGLKAINYDDRYYSHDNDFIDNIITEYPGGGGYNAGYSAQAQTTVFVEGRTMPWDKTDNPSYIYGVDDGKQPVVVPLQVGAGATINIAADAPGEPVQVWFWSYATNEVKCSDARDPVDAAGQADDITGSTTGSTGEHFPTYFMPGSTLGLGGLCGAFAHLSDGKYIVDQVLDIGFGGNFTVPAGATHLLLGINDDKFRDNSGGFQVHVLQVGATTPDPTPDDTASDPSNTDYVIITVDGN